MTENQELIDNLESVLDPAYVIECTVCGDAEYATCSERRAAAKTFAELRWRVEGDDVLCPNCVDVLETY